MHFSPSGRLAAVALAASAATATPMNAPAPLAERHLGLLQSVDTPLSANISLDADLSGISLVEGIVADVNALGVAGVAAGVDVGVFCNDCYLKGEIDASVSLKNIVPALSLELTDIEAVIWSHWHWEYVEIITCGLVR